MPARACVRLKRSLTLPMKSFMLIVALSLTTAAQGFVAPTCPRGAIACRAADGADVSFACNPPGECVKMHCALMPARAK